MREFITLISICSLLCLKMNLIDGGSVNKVSLTPTVCMQNLGCVEGIKMQGYQVKNFDAFLGIPYAKPPIGELRLANPVPIDAWNGTLKANLAKQDCAQKNYLLATPIVYGSENCLYLNVYRPSASGNTRNTRLPVMVYIYGGGFFSGSANPLIHGPEYFMDTNEVILVTIAYRLGALGFLSTGDDVIPGNFALKDQVLALKWVQKNIESFGGDRSSVTLFGQSAGAASVHMHMFSSLSKGLFHRAIVMSGNAGAPYNDVIKNPLEQTRKQAKLCGISNADQLTNKQLLKALRDVDLNTFITAGDGFKYWHVDPLTTFRAVVEQNTSDAFLIDDPNDYIRNGNYNHVPWMTGFVPYEGAVRALSITSNETLRNEFNDRFDYLLEKLMEFNDDNTTKHQQQQEKQQQKYYQASDKINRIVNYYLNGTHELTPDNSQRFGDIISDRAFLHPLYRTIKNYVRYADLEKNPVYLYKFSYKGPYSYSYLYTGNFNNFGVVHCDDLIYLFRSPLLFPSDFGKNSTDAKVIRAYVETFVTFAKTGEPKKWTPIKKCNLDSIKNMETNNAICDYQEFKNSENSDNFTIRTNNFYDMNAMKIWDELLQNEII